MNLASSAQALAAFEPFVLAVSDAECPHEYNEEFVKLGPGLLASVRRDEDFCLLEARLPAHVGNRLRADPDWALALLRRNATLPANLRLALDTARRLVLRAEVPILEEFAVAGRMPGLLEAVAAAAASLNASTLLGGGLSVPPAEEPAPAAGSGAGPGLEPLCQATDWPCHARANGKLGVELEVPNEGLVALVALAGRGGVRVAVELLELEPLSPAARRAVALFLLLTGDRLRLARAAFADYEGRAAAVLEVVHEQSPGAAELALAFESLSVGARLCVCETRLLRDEHFAADLLATAGWQPGGEAPESKL